MEGDVHVDPVLPHLPHQLVEEVHVDTVLCPAPQRDGEGEDVLRVLRVDPLQEVEDLLAGAGGQGGPQGDRDGPGDSSLPEVTLVLLLLDGRVHYIGHHPLTVI